VTPPADVRLTIAPARGIDWIRLSSTTRRLAVGLLFVLLVGGVGLLVVPAHVRPRLIGLLVVAGVLSLLVVLLRATSSGRVRVEVGRKELVVVGIRSPVRVALRDIGSAVIVENSKQGLGFHDPLLVVLNREGRAIFSLAGRPWNQQDWVGLLRTIGVRTVDRIPEPLTRREFDRRYPGARSAVETSAVRRRKRLGLVLGVVWGIIIVLLLLH
jgi:hypothetical protein